MHASILDAGRPQPAGPAVRYGRRPARGPTEDPAIGTDPAPLGDGIGGPERAAELAPDADRIRIAGVDVHQRRVGSGAPAVVLLHHTFGNVLTWRHVQRGLADHVTSIAFDRPGFGMTERPPRRRWNGANPYTRRFGARLVTGLLDHHGFDRAVLVGASIGGTLALETYARFPDRVAGMVLLSPAITGDVGPPAPLRPLLRTGPARALGTLAVRRLVSGLSTERIGQGWADPSRASAADVAAYRAPLADPAWSRGLWEVLTAEPPPMLVEVLANVRVPTIVAAGDHDRVIRPESNRRTAGAIPGARFRLLPDAGHTPHEERPDLVVATILDLVRDLD